MNYDFCGWATKNDLRCSDGRTIRKDAFKDNDGQIVPLVWNHDHNDPMNVLGHALLENRSEGVYAYCSFNDTTAGQNAKELVRHGDVKSLSIYANKLKQMSGDVIHGVIREVSLVLAGANPGATIESIIEHSGYSDEEEALILSIGDEAKIEHTATVASKEPEPEVVKEEPPKKKTKAKKEETEETLEHADGELTVKQVWDAMSDKKKKVAQFIIGMMAKENGLTQSSDSDEDENFSDLEHAEQEAKSEGEETINDIWNTFTEDEKKVVEILADNILKNADEDYGEDDEGDNEEMKHNVFENDKDNNQEVLTHSELMSIMNEAQHSSSLKEVFLSHGIEDIEYLFPEAHNLNTPPEFIKRPDSWVSKVMGGVHHTPFSRIKSMFADITEADARARGYIKGNRKVEEVFGLLKRTTTPTTVYKKQKLDRDDVIDITDFDVIAWLKTEMRAMLDEELARAYLIGDGRNPMSEDKINESNIRPIWTDDDLFTIKVAVSVAANATDDQKVKAVHRALIKARKNYRGTGNPTFWTTEDFLADSLLLEDTIGHKMFKTEAEVATAIRAKEIVTVPVMENQTRVKDGKTYELVGILVNLADYNVGADKGGAVNMFDDFDIDYNQMKYLIETRCSGALTKPFSAIAIELTYNAVLTVDPSDPTDTLLGKSVASLQEDVLVNDNFIKGTLKYVTGFTGYSGDVDEQSGNYLALKFGDSVGATTTIELTGSPIGPVELDEDKEAVLRIYDKNTQKLKVTTALNGETIAKTYSLTGLKLEKA